MQFDGGLQTTKSTVKNEFGMITASVVLLDRSIETGTPKRLAADVFGVTYRWQ